MSYDDALAALQRALSFGMNPSLDGITELARGARPPAGPLRERAGHRHQRQDLDHAADRRAPARGGHARPGCSRARTSSATTSASRSTARPSATTISRSRSRRRSQAADALRPADAPGTPAGFTEFELLTAAALWLFRERGVEIAVLEVGLGGRWDATSVVSPSVAVITGVGLDHTAVLGDTLEAIAAEKAAIIRPASAPVLGPGTDGLDSIFLRAADVASTHARAVREDLEFSPVPEELTVRFRVVERPSSPDGHTLVSVDGVHAQLPGARALVAPRTRPPTSRRRSPRPRRRSAERCTSSAPGPRCAALDASRPLRARARRRRRSSSTGRTTRRRPRSSRGAIRDAFPDPAVRPLLLLGILADKDARGIVEALAPVAGGDRGHAVRTRLARMPADGARASSSPR